MKTLLLLSLAIATTFSFQTPVHAQGGTLITEASALGYLGYSGYYGDELAAIEDGTGSYDLLIAEPVSNAQVHVRDGLTGVESASIPSPGRSLSAVPDVDGDGREDILSGSPKIAIGGQAHLWH